MTRRGPPVDDTPSGPRRDGGERTAAAPSTAAEIHDSAHAGGTHAPAMARTPPRRSRPGRRPPPHRCACCAGVPIETTVAALRDEVERFGWTYVHVDGEEPWTYTIGLHRHASVELVVTGLDGFGGREALDAVAARLHVVIGHLGMGRPDELSALDRRWRLVDVDEDAWLAGPFALWPPVMLPEPDDALPPVVQVLWCDEDGRFPDDAACAPFVVAHQPLLGGRPA